MKIVLKLLDKRQVEVGGDETLYPRQVGHSLHSGYPRPASVSYPTR